MVKKSVNLNSIEGFYRDIYRNALTTKYHNDLKANWILAISAGIMGILVPYISEALKTGNYGYIVIFSSAFISLIMGLMILEIPAFFKLPKHDNKDLMYFNKTNIRDLDEYMADLLKVKTREQIVEQYARDLFNMYGRNISVKNRMLKIQVDILLVGIFIGVFLLFLV